MHPAALMRHPRVTGLQGRCQPRTAIGDDQLQLLTFQASPVQIPLAALPTLVGSLPGCAEIPTVDADRPHPLHRPPASVPACAHPAADS